MVINHNHFVIIGKLNEDGLKLRGNVPFALKSRHADRNLRTLDCHAYLQALSKCALQSIPGARNLSSMCVAMLGFGTQSLRRFPPRICGHPYSQETATNPPMAIRS